VRSRLLGCYRTCKIGFSQGSWWWIKDLKEKKALFTSKGNCGGAVSHKLKVQGEQSGGIAKTNSWSRSSRDYMQA